MSGNGAATPGKARITTMTTATFTAKRVGHDKLNVERHGISMLSVQVDDAEYLYPYTLANIRHDIEPGTWKVWGLARRDIGLHRDEPQTFTTKEEACAHIRRTYTTAKETFLEREAALKALLASELPEVEPYGRSARDPAPTIIMTIIPTEKSPWGKQDSFAARLTIQEAFAVLEVGYEKFGVVGTDPGIALPGSHLNRHGFAEWRIPAYSSDYHLAGYRSRSGRARKAA